METPQAEAGSPRRSVRIAALSSPTSAPQSLSSPTTAPQTETTAESQGQKRSPTKSPPKPPTETSSKKLPRRYGTKKPPKLLSDDAIPQYGKVQLSSDGKAIIPVNFLPGQPESLPDVWYYATLEYFAYFDRSQRDKDDNVVKKHRFATPETIQLWKEKVSSIFGETMKEEGKLAYGLELGRIAQREGWMMKGQKNEPKVSTDNNVLELFFSQVVPVYEKDDNMGMIVASLWNWFHAPLLEANNGWVKMTLEL